MNREYGLKDDIATYSDTQMAHLETEARLKAGVVALQGDSVELGLLKGRNARLAAMVEAVDNRNAHLERRIREMAGAANELRLGSFLLGFAAGAGLVGALMVFL